jgi:hypothetical protein
MIQQSDGAISICAISFRSLRHRIRSGQRERLRAAQWFQGRVALRTGVKTASGRTASETADLLQGLFILEDPRGQAPARDYCNWDRARKASRPRPLVAIALANALYTQNTGLGADRRAPCFVRFI